MIITHSGTNSFCNNPLVIKTSAKAIPGYAKLIYCPNHDVSSPAAVPAQSSQSSSYTSKAVYFNFSASSAPIVNSDIFNDDNWEVSKGFGVGFEVGYLLKFNKTIGIGFGAGYSSYSTELKLNPLTYDVPDIDVDGDNYIKNIITGEILEETSISYFDIPVFLELSNMNIDKIGFYGRIGLKVSFPLSSSFTSSGLADYEGYYSQYYVTLYDIDELGFTEKEIYQEPEVASNSVNISALISAGLTFPISNYFIIRLGANADFGLTDVSAQKATDYENTKYDGNYNKLLENPNAKTTIRSFGGEIGLIYNLRLRSY